MFEIDDMKILVTGSAGFIGFHLTRRLLMDFIDVMERAFGCEAKKVFLPMQPGDVYQTYADTSALERDFGYKPRIGVEEGIRRFAEWRMERADLFA